LDRQQPSGPEEPEQTKVKNERLDYTGDDKHGARTSNPKGSGEAGERGRVKGEREEKGKNERRALK
jgi:hypothetical protein